MSSSLAKQTWSGTSEHGAAIRNTFATDRELVMLRVWYRRHMVEGPLAMYQCYPAIRWPWFLIRHRLATTTSPSDLFRQCSIAFETQARSSLVCHRLGQLLTHTMTASGLLFLRYGSTDSTTSALATAESGWSMPDIRRTHLTDIGAVTQAWQTTSCGTPTGQTMPNHSGLTVKPYAVKRQTNTLTMAQ